jgi:hypothetical protein
VNCHYPKHEENVKADGICPLCGAEDERAPLLLKKKGGRPPKILHLPGADLFLGSNPQQSLPLFDNTVDGKRKLHCRRYDNCLGYAMKMNWNSFDCLDCKIEEMITKDAWTYDLEGLADLLRAIIGS